MRYLTELHGGRVAGASNGAGCGAVFTVSLPVAAVPSSDATSTRALPRGPAPLPPEVGALRDARILIVEHNPDTREMLRGLLERSGAAVRAVPSAAEGLRAAEREPPDLVISDIEMPDGDGYQFMRTLREREAGTGRCIPAVALTAYAHPNDPARAFQAGFQHHLAKPVDPPELLAALVSLIGRTDR